MYAFLSSTCISKAAGERPEIAPQLFGPVVLDVSGEIGGQPVAFQVTADGIGVGAPSEAVATCKIGTYDLAARLLRRMGAVGPAAESILAEELAALLSGDAVDCRGLEDTAKRLAATFAAKLPKVARAGGVTVRGARLAVTSRMEVQAAK